MKKRKRVFALLLGVFGLVLAGTAAGNSEKLNEISVFEDLMEIWDQDMLWDGNSVYFENGAVKLREDMADNPHTAQDQESGILTEVSGDGWSAAIAVHEKMGMPELMGKEYRYVESNRLYEMIPVTPDENFEDSEAVSFLKDITNHERMWAPYPGSVKDREKLLDSLGSSAYQNKKLYRGIRNVNGTYMAGYTRWLEDYFGHLPSLLMWING